EPWKPVRRRVERASVGNGVGNEIRDRTEQALRGVVREAGAVRAAGAPEATAQLQQRRVEREQDRQLEQQREASRRRIHAVLLVELHLLFGEALAILAVLALELVHRRSELLHRALRADLRAVERIHDEPDE